MGRPGSLAPCPIALDHGPGTTAAMGRQSEEPAGPLMWVTGRLVARLTRCGRSIAIQRDRSQRPGHTGPWPCSCWAAGSRRAGPGRHGGVDPGCSPARLVSGLSRIAVWEGIGPGPVRRRQAFSGRGSADRGPGPKVEEASGADRPSHGLGRHPGPTPDTNAVERTLRHGSNPKAGEAPGGSLEDTTAHESVGRPLIVTAARSQRTR
jgi:hypothetical protein